MMVYNNFHKRYCLINKALKLKNKQMKEVICIGIGNFGQAVTDKFYQEIYEEHKLGQE